MIALLTVSASVVRPAAGMRPAPLTRGWSGGKAARAWLAGLLAIVAGAGRLAAEIEFVGILATPQVSRFALGDTATGRTEWVGRGEAFAGFTVQSFDAAADVITLARDGKELRLHLKEDAKVKPSRLELTGAITFGAEAKIEVARATLRLDEDNEFPLNDGATYRIRPERREDGTIRYSISVERPLAENKTERISAPAVVALPGQKFSVQIDNLSFSFTPKFP